MNHLKQYLRQMTLSWSFIVIVLIPSVFSIVYFGLIASDRYVSVSNFVVRSPQKSPSAGGLSALLQNVGFSRSQDDAYVVNDFIVSRDAIFGLDRKFNIRETYSNNHIDILSRFNPLGLDGSTESFYKYYQDKIVKVTLDSASSITTLEVHAYSAESAYKTNNELLNMAESLVNRLNQRGRSDLVVNAEADVKEAQEKVAVLSKQLINYRANNQIFDIEKQSGIQLQLISKLQDQLITVTTQIAQLKAVTPENPQIQILSQRESSIRNEISKAQATVIGSGQNSLNEKSSEYERIVVEKEVATKQLAAALAALEQNKNDAARKQLYLERIAQPLLPDVAVEPKRFKNIVSIIIISLVIWGVYSLLIAGVREHKN